jgi:hypothetical protein
MRTERSAPLTEVLALVLALFSLSLLGLSLLLQRLTGLLSCRLLGGSVRHAGLHSWVVVVDQSGTDVRAARSSSSATVATPIAESPIPYGTARVPAWRRAPQE